MPLDWMATADLGVALARLGERENGRAGERESGTARLEEAARDYNAALEVS